MSTQFIPSLLVPEIYFPVHHEKGFTVNLLEKMAADGFYRSFEIADGQDQQERKRILALKEQYHFQLTQWLTFLIDKNKLDVSSVDSQLRSESVRQIKENIYLAAECGASNIAFVPGPDPGPERRLEAMEGFYHALCDICEEAAKYQMNVLVEHLDRFAHKKRLIGPMKDTVELLSRVAEKHDNIGLAFDTAHAALNKEGIAEALELAKVEIHQIHFSNAVVDPTNNLYGDFHMPIGEPGFLTIEKISDILRKADELSLQSERGLRVAVEVRGTDKDNYQANEKTVRSILEKALGLVASR
ncbi:sugar phosphate isomerase/epimerase family protein [Neobacillus sp. OS1-2]|uniref:sugar phosphate isomerase/epimerase family protein n=1 Tax=Neobacillus sp. OS1-2 TaxID=3070680 RepID=UPI0027DEAEFF|nr:sugar phosphate isomerase/epimerase family protein [Neobacillus sp. OS1-2]WML41390.1 sugar phosphate isomerase/epimerase family protein [Neobacillus sp. OS1-2]